jgi:hypothetical protein
MVKSSGRQSTLLENNLVGRKLESIERLEYHNWTFNLNDGSTLTVETHWRIISATEIEITCEDDQQMFGQDAPVDAQAKAWSLLAGREVSEVTVRTELSDLFLSFGPELRLEILNLSSGYEAWNFTNSAGLIVVGRNGE